MTTPKRPTCISCAFYQEWNKPCTADWIDPDTGKPIRFLGKGECRINPPDPRVKHWSGGETGWPEVTSADWCGSHTQRDAANG